MDFTNVRLQLTPLPDPSPGGKSINLPLYGITPSTKYIFKGAEGLSVADQSIILGDSFGASTFPQHMAANPRDIVIKVGLNPDYSGGETAAALRQELYSYMGAFQSRPVTLGLERRENDVVVEDLTIDGYISKIESDIFSQSTDVFVTIKCSTSFFKRITPIFDSPVDTYVTNSFSITLEGTAFTSFLLEIWPDQLDVVDMTISADTTPNYLHFSNGDGGLYASSSYDTLYISTELANPEVTRRIGGSPFSDDWENMINYLTFDSNFFVLPPGPATITIDLPDSYWLNRVTLFEYFWGV